HPLDDHFNNALVSVFVSIPVGLAVFMFDLTIVETVMLTLVPVLVGNVICLDPLRHSQFPVSFGRLDRILISPRMHHVHHSEKRQHWNKNFGKQLWVWDWMFGTAVVPAKGEALTYGIGEGREVDQSYESVYGVYVLPVIRAVRLLIPSFAGSPAAPAAAAESL